MTEHTAQLPQQRITGFAASPRKNGNSDILLKYMIDGAEQMKVPAEKILLRDYVFEPCIGCEQCRKNKSCTGINDGMHLLYPKIIQSQGLIMISPTHNYNITAWMKAFIDRLYCFYNFDNACPRGWSSRLANQNRKAVIAAVCEQENKKDMGFTLEAMRLPLIALGYEIVGELAVFKIFKRGGVKKETEILTKAANLGRDLALAISDLQFFSDGDFKPCG